MYRKEVNERSPMRVFEKSMHGGLGRGNIGVVVRSIRAWARRRSSCRSPSTICSVIAASSTSRTSTRSTTSAPTTTRSSTTSPRSPSSPTPTSEKLDLERHRLIFSLMSQSLANPPSLRGGRSSMAKILETVTFAKEVAHFVPDVIVIDDFDFEHATEEAVAALRNLARESNVELWLSAHAEAMPEEPGRAAGAPRALQRAASPSWSSSSPSATSSASAS